MENEIELNGNTDPRVVEKYLRDLGWYSYNGFLRVLYSSSRFQSFSVDVRQLFQIYARETDVVDQNGNMLNGVKVIMEFHGGKEMYTRVYPTEEQAWKDIISGILWLRDYYLGLAEHEIAYSGKMLYTPLPKPTWDSYIATIDTENSDFKWTHKNDESKS